MVDYCPKEPSSPDLCASFIYKNKGQRRWGCNVKKAIHHFKYFLVLARLQRECVHSSFLLPFTGGPGHDVSCKL